MNNGTHGQSSPRTPEYNCWINIAQRCGNPRATKYGQYGARGITFYRPWQDSFLLFMSAVGPRPSAKHSLDRYPNRSGNYEPGNVRWATAKEQSQNSSFPRIIEVDGKRMNESEWAKELGVSKCAIANRIFKGMTPEQAVVIPFRASRYRRVA